MRFKRLMLWLGRWMAILALCGLTAWVSISAVMSSIGASTVQALPGQVAKLPGANNVPLPSSPDPKQQVLQQAATTPGGRALVQQGYAATAMVRDRDLSQFLDAQRKGTSSGPYVVFTPAQAKVGNAPGEGTSDLLVDGSSGEIVAVDQYFANDRGAVCYVSSQSDRTVVSDAAAWKAIVNLGWLKSMPQQVPISHSNIPQVPASAGTIPCFIYSIKSS